MTQPLQVCHPVPKESSVKDNLVQNKLENGIPCIKCNLLVSHHDFVDHIKLHVASSSAGKMAHKKSNVESVKHSKTVVKLETMNIPIKRKRHGSSGENSKRIKLQDGETELSVDPTVDKVLCKSCKPAKYFKDVAALRYHLICSHNVSKSSSYYHDPSSSPAKIFSPVKRADNSSSKKVRVKSNNEISEIVDMEGLSTEPVTTSSASSTPAKTSVTTTESPVTGGKFSDLLKVRRMNMKRTNVVNCRTPKLQPVCLSDKKEIVLPVASEVIDDCKNKSINSDVDKDEKTDLTPKKRKSRRISELSSSSESSVDTVGSEELNKVSEKENKAKVPAAKEVEFAVPAPVKKSKSVKTPKVPEVKDVPRRRVSERRFEGAKPFKCNHCQLSYSSLENKKVHEQTHIEKNLLCLYCDMRFYYPLCLKRHNRIHKS